jgi:hypothetical protein
LNGHARVGDESLEHGVMAMLSEREAQLEIAAGADGFRALLLQGQPLNEPVVRYGPFVMNTREEVYQAVEDYQNGRMGQIRPEVKVIDRE